MSSAVGMKTLQGKMDIKIVIFHIENGRRKVLVATDGCCEQEELMLVFEGGCSARSVGGNNSVMLMSSVVFVDNVLLLEKVYHC